MASLNDYLPDVIDDPTSAARIVLAELRRHHELDLLVPVIAGWIDNIARERVRAVEREAFRTRPLPLPLPESVLESITATRAVPPEWLQLLTCTFHVRQDGEVVTWGAATVGQHLERAEYLERMASRIFETAQRHRHVAKVCVEAGVACLNDLVGGAE